MYCSTCGVAVSQGLTYCNYCGAKLSGPTGASPKSPEVNPESLVRLMASVFVLGLFVITLFTGMMKAVLRFEIGLLIFFTLLSFLIMLLVEAVFVFLLFRGKRTRERADGAELIEQQTTRELDAARQRALSEPAASVTEHTTRTLDPVLNERKPL